MRIIGWNIRAGGGRRIAGIRAQLQRWQADIITLSEFRGTPPSQQLAQWLYEDGFVHQLTAVDPQKKAKNGLLLASRFPFTPITLSLPMVKTTRWLLATVQTAVPLTIGVMHIPNRVSGRKDAFYADVVAVATAWKYGRGLLIGDTNSGLPDVDEETAVFGRREVGFFSDLAAVGWTDTFRHLHGDEQAFTWYSPNGKNGFRLDQAFANEPLLPLVHEVVYVWGREVETAVAESRVRRDALSDHAAIIVDIIEG